MVLYLYITFFLFFLNEKENEIIVFNKQHKTQCDVYNLQPNSQIPRLEMSGNIKLLIVGHNLAALNAPGSRTERVVG